MGGVGETYVINIRQIHHRHRPRLIAPKERRPPVQPLCHKHIHSRYGGHPRQPRRPGLHVRVQDLGAVGEIGGGGGAGHGRVGRVVVDDEDVDGAVQHRPDGVVLVCFAAVDEGEFRGAGDARAGGVVEEGVWVGCVFVAGGCCVGFGYDAGEGGD